MCILTLLLLMTVKVDVYTEEAIHHLAQLRDKLDKREGDRDLIVVTSHDTIAMKRSTIAL
jgi:hypothetical protein